VCRPRVATAHGVCLLLSTGKSSPAARLNGIQSLEMFLKSTGSSVIRKRWGQPTIGGRSQDDVIGCGVAEVVSLGLAE